MNLNEITIEALELTVQYFQEHYDINETNALEASEKITKYFVANAEKLVRAVIEGKLSAIESQKA
jgi:hypothetical protein